MYGLVTPGRKYTVGQVPKFEVFLHVSPWVKGRGRSRGVHLTDDRTDLGNDSEGQVKHSPVLDPRNPLLQSSTVFGVQINLFSQRVLLNIGIQLNLSLLSRSWLVSDPFCLLHIIVDSPKDYLSCPYRPTRWLWSTGVDWHSHRLYISDRHTVPILYSPNPLI